MSASWSKVISSPKNIHVTTNGDPEIHGLVNSMGSSTLKVARLVLYFAWTLALMPVQWTGLALDYRWVTTLPTFYHRWCCRLLGFRVRTIGRPTTRRPVLFAANHISYTDITILGSLIAGSFIAKSEVAHWPFFGWLARLQRTVFVDRRIRSTATRRDGIPIGRAYRPLVAWYGAMDLLTHLWGMIGLGTVEVVVQFHPPTLLTDCVSLKALAGYCFARVSGGMAGALFGRPQPLPTPPASSVRKECLAEITSRAAA